jgi:hypothetical protein
MHKFQLQNDRGPSPKLLSALNRKLERIEEIFRITRDEWMALSSASLAEGQASVGRLVGFKVRRQELIYQVQQIEMEIAELTRSWPDETLSFPPEVQREMEEQINARLRETLVFDTGIKEALTRAKDQLSEKLARVCLGEEALAQYRPSSFQTPRFCDQQV